MAFFLNKKVGSVCIGLILTWFTVSFAQGQTAGEITLKTGEVVRGYIDAHKLKGPVTIKDETGHTRRIPMDDIAHIRQGFTSDKQVYLVEPNNWDKGMYYRISAGVGFTQAEWNNGWGGGTQRFLAGSFVSEASVGYRLSRSLQVGVGTGYFTNDGNFNFFPFYAEVAGDVTLPKSSWKIMPHYQVQAGYGATAGTPWWQNVTVFRGGLYTQIGAGLKLRSQRRLEWTALISLRSQTAYQEYSPWELPGSTVKGNRQFRALNFQVGVMF